MIATILALLFASPVIAPQPMADMVCDSYYFDAKPATNPTHAVRCHSDERGDVWLDNAYIEVDTSPDDGEAYMFVTGYLRKEIHTTEL